MKLIIYIPALNEEKRIAKTIQSLPQQIPGIDVIEVVVINDGSHDDTADIARKYGAKVISHTSNFGVGAAFHSGIIECLKNGADIMLSIDADGQFDVKDIPNLIEPITSGKADFVTGNRFHKGSSRPEFMSKTKYWGNKQIARFVSKMTQKKIDDVACGFRAYSREAMLNLNLVGKFTYTQETILDLVHKGFRLTEVPISVTYFQNRTSRVASSIVKYAFNTFLIIFRSYRDYHPLRLFGGAGLVLFTLGCILDTIILFHYLNTGTITPYKMIGAIGGFLNILGLLTVILAILADMFDRQRVTQEKILYFLKKNEYSPNSRTQNDN